MEIHIRILPLNVALHPLLATIIAIISISSVTSLASLSCSDSDLQSLEAMMQSSMSMKLAIAARKKNSSSNNCCEWQGFLCDRHGHVVSVELSSSAIAGTIPLHLFNLTSLQIIDLSNNSLSGPISIAIATKLPRISYIDLSHNPLLSAPFPSSLPSSLRYLDLSHCSMQGAMAMSSLANATSLEELFISNNFFSSFVQGRKGGAMAMESASSSLRVLDASRNLLQGPFPMALLELVQLWRLNLEENHLQGLIPADISKLRSIQKLRLRRNNLTGQIPESIQNCRQLKEITLDENSLSGFIPEALSQLKFLTVLSLANNKLKGPIPIAIARCSSLIYLSLSDNSLSGHVPQEIADMPNLQVLHLDQTNPVRNGTNQWKQVGDQKYRRIKPSPPLIPKAAEAGVLKRAGYGSHSWSYQESHSSSYQKSHSWEGSKEKVYSRRRWLSEGASNVKPVIIGVMCGGGLFCVAMAMVVMVYKCRSRGSKEIVQRIRRRQQSSESTKVFDPSLKSMSMRDLDMATDHFNASRIIGDGGFGLVYSGTLQDGHRHVAIKKLSSHGVQGTREFQAEIETIGSIKHPNLVQLLAYCHLGDDRLLVYELLVNGSLNSWLHDNPQGPQLLPWSTRLKIAQGIARGLSFLHHECTPSILHRDITSSNILLSSHFEPKIADFGLARFLSPMVSHVSTDVAGTIGYMAPEYCLSLGATKEADVYSFGVLLLELVTGRRPNMLIQEKGSWTLARWAISMVEQEREMELLDPSLLHHSSPISDQVYNYFHISCSCVHECPSKRPTMKKVFELLSLIQ